ncbi:MAG: diguanylate cyclase/phosphodiesterase (GGDEF & EAL domains) with PAS/PAC sensor(s) [Nitrospira sp.]|jgi:PAS domain S-box-containing protein|nr:MAG: diguanylate cyclase/phosphodiesterase (GGDEF & EAL domains) with PAS/PAC sensor(s) [Nitrospira sp.]
MQLTLERKTEIAIALMLVLLLAIGFVAYRSSTEFISSSAQVVHSREVRGSLQRILSLVEEIETGQRGYIITGESSFLEPYQRAMDRIEERLVHVKTLITDEPQLQAQIETLIRLVQSRIAFAAESIELRRARGFAAARDLLLSGKGKQEMDQIRTLIIEIRETEKIQLQEQSNRTGALAQSTITVVEAGSALAVVVVLIMATAYRWGLTARRRTEKALQESLAKQTLVMRALPVVIYSAKASEDFGALWVSDNIELVSGFPGSSFLNQPGLWATRLHPDDRERVLREFEKISDVGALHVEYRWQVADGSYRWFLDRALLQTTSDGSSQEILGLWLDITERKATDERLREVNDRLTALVQASPVGIVILDAEGLCRLWNPAAEKIYGWREEEVLGRPLPTVVPEQSDEHRCLRERVMEDKAFTDLEVLRYRKDGTLVHTSLSTAPLRDPHGTICGVLGLMVDMTQRKQIEFQLSQSRDQLRALMTRLHSAREEEGTRIAREVHDELGQAMTSLKLDLSWVARRLSLPEMADSRAQMRERLQGAMRQLDGTIQSVRAIATALRPSVLDELGLAAALDWQTRDFEKRTGIRCEWSMPSVPIPIGPDQATAIFRIYQEILTNVVRHAQASAIHIRLDISANWLVLEVSDNGLGIPASALTHPNSLGLLGMRERATQWGGDLSIRGTAGKGTTVTVRLPVLGGAA